VHHKSEADASLFFLVPRWKSAAISFARRALLQKGNKAQVDMNFRVAWALLLGDWMIRWFRAQWAPAQPPNHPIT
jgi:hypothetical protein